MACGTCSSSESRGGLSQAFFHKGGPVCNRAFDKVEQMEAGKILCETSKIINRGYEISIPVHLTFSFSRMLSRYSNSQPVKARSFI
jgi:hypothetical protein